MNFGLRHIQCFLTLAEDLHFTNAAARLNMTQPALSRTISELEQRIGVTLFQRTTRTVELTEAGKIFRVECGLGLDHLRRAVTIARRYESGEAGTVRIGCTDFAINGMLPAFIREFNLLRPGIRLELSFTPTSMQHEALVAGHIEVGFKIGAIDSKHIDSFVFHNDRYAALLPSDHPLATKANLCLSDLALEPFVMGNLENWSAYRGELLPIYRRAGFFPDIVQEAPTTNAILGLVAAGTGVSIYAGCIRNLKREGVVIRKLTDVPEKITTCAVWLNPIESPNVRDLVEFMKQTWSRRSRGHVGKMTAP